MQPLLAMHSKGKGMTSYWEVLGPVGGSVSIYDGPELFLREFAALSAKEATLLAAHWYQSEICNGGFNQFFGNSAGVLAPEAVAAFISIGMPAVRRTTATRPGLSSQDVRAESLADGQRNVGEVSAPAAAGPIGFASNASISARLVPMPVLAASWR
jgi:hypothetical protein